MIKLYSKINCGLGPVAILRRQMCKFLVLELEESIFTRLSRIVLKFINFKMAF